MRSPRIATSTRFPSPPLPIEHQAAPDDDVEICCREQRRNGSSHTSGEKKDAVHAAIEKVGPRNVDLNFARGESVLFALKRR